MSLKQPNAPCSTVQGPCSAGLSLTVVLRPRGFQPSVFVLLWPQWPAAGFKGSAPGQAAVQCGLCSVLQRLTSKYMWMLTFFSLQSTNGMLFFAFADSFLIRTCLGILFASLLMLLSYTNTSFIPLTSSAPCHSYSASSDLVPLSPSLPLLSAVHQRLFVSSPSSWEVRDVVLHDPGSLAALGVCLSCYQAGVHDEQGLHGSLCFTWPVLDCVSAGGVAGPVSHSLFLLQL